jgi:hypothetical protein
MPVCGDCADVGHCTKRCKPIEKWTKAMLVDEVRRLRRRPEKVVASTWEIERALRTARIWMAVSGVALALAAVVVFGW